MKCNETQGKWCKNKHGASKIIDTFETYHGQILNCGNASMISGAYGKVDSDQRDAGISCVWSAGSFASRRGAEGRLESPWAPESFAHGCLH
jgi:hypothetical protein